MSNHTAALKHPVSQRDHSRGPEHAPITLVEYGDFECPHCGAAFPIVERLIRHFGDRLRFVYRHFPLSQVHEHAQLAAEAAEAAGAQGKFWEMHHALFAHQNALDAASLVRYAANTGIDGERVQHELTSHTYRDHVRSDFMDGVRSGVNGTPTFFINGVRHDGSFDQQTLGEAIEAAAPSALR